MLHQCTRNYDNMFGCRVVAQHNYFFKKTESLLRDIIILHQCTKIVIKYDLVAELALTERLFWANFYPSGVPKIKSFIK